ncbi:MAG TPA: biotin/lipoyl-containing protein [Myxococcales bacterium]|nr:biotin/lipoyl-containing protein [Myxococcales bacterium]
MRYHALIGGEERLIEVAPQGSSYRVTIHDGRTESANPRVLAVDAVHLAGHAMSLLVDGRSVRCEVEPAKEGKLAVLVGDEVHSLEILDERRLRLRRASGKFMLEGPQRIDAPMPGKVVRVLVKQGDQVQEGQGLVVVEAMKMENELRSPKAGVVKELHAQEGQPVEAGAKLAVVA